MVSKRPLVAEDLFRFALVGRTAIHPNGRHAICEITHFDETNNETVTHLWHVDTNGGERMPFTWGEGTERCPQYAPDGHFVAYLGRDRNGVAQVYIMRADGGQAIQVTEAAQDVQSFLWHPSGSSLLYQTRIDIAPVRGVSDTPRHRFTKDIRVIERTFYRLDGVGFFGNTRTHLFAVDVQALTKHHSLASDAVRTWSFPVRQVTGGDYDVAEYALHPDGERLVFVSNLDADADETLTHHVYEIAYPQDFTQSDLVAPRRLPLTLTQVDRLAYDSTGRLLALLGHRREAGQYTLSQLYVYDVEQGTLANVSAGSELTFGNAMLSDLRADVPLPLVWSPDGRFLYTIASAAGQAQMVRIGVAEPACDWLTTGRQCVLSFALDCDCATAVLLLETALAPADLYVLNVSPTGETNTAPRALTDVNHTLLQQLNMVEPRRLRVDDGETPLEGWVLLPPEPPPATGYPGVVEVHGGPVAAYGEAFMFEFQLLAQSGIAVLFCNPRGSLGYGQAYTQAIRGRWGTDDFADIERFVATACAQQPLDASRLAIAGGSYGGFMAAFAIGHTDRYRAAVVMRACVNEYSMFGTSDTGFLDIEDLAVAPWQAPQRYANLSPLVSADKMKASVLILHAENDLRCPVEQAEQLYAALRYHRVPVKMIRFPGESHDMSRSGKPWHRVVRLEYIEQFLRDALKEQSFGI